MQRFHFLLIASVHWICEYFLGMLWQSACRLWIWHSALFFLHQVGKKTTVLNKAEANYNTHIQAVSTACVWCSRISFLSAMVSFYVCVCTCVWQCVLHSKSVSAQVAVEIWMHGVTALLSHLHFFCSHCLSAISCDKGIQGEWVCFKSHFYCH